jgi:hypothetical protein
MADGGISALAIASLALTAVGTGVAVMGSIAQGEAASKASEYNAKVAENNAQAQTDQAAYAAQRTREKGLRVLGSQRAQAGAMGVDLAGSFEDVAFDTSISNELDALAEEYQGKIGAGRSKSQAELFRMEGASAKQASMFGAASSLLTGVGKGISMYDPVRSSRPPSIKASSVNMPEF